MMPRPMIAVLIVMTFPEFQMPVSRAPLTNSSKAAKGLRCLDLAQEHPEQRAENPPPKI
jgi:hypothetical protein